MNRLASAMALLGTFLVSGLAAQTGNANLSERDRELEQALLKGSVVERRSIGKGVTRPSKLIIQHGGTRYEAAFKTVDIHTPGLTDFNDGQPPIINFTDSYRFERASYLVDRELGLHMVPVSVVRRFRREKGAITEWIGDAIDETARREEGLRPPDPQYQEHQKALMRLFDALILNTDRNAGNRLITPVDWKLHLIDHSRSFRPEEDLPESFTGRLIVIRPDVYERLKGMEAGAMTTLLKGLVSKVRVQAMLARRDAIVATVEAERKSRGDQNVFFEEQ